MALTISQISASAYPLVLADKRKPVNQWAESAFLNYLEKSGGIIRRDFGPTLEVPLDYRKNQGAGWSATDLAPTSLLKTDVITAASYSFGELTSPITWSTRDEVMTPTDNQKIAFTESLITNAIATHDDLIELALFNLTTGGFLGLPTHMTDAGTGSDGGIDSSIEVWWKNQQATYVDDTDIEAAFTSVYNLCAKGTGSSVVPTFMVSDGATNAIFEGTQQGMQRWADQDFKAGAKTIMFKTANYLFSQYGSSKVFFGNPKSFQVVVAKDYFRKHEPEVKLQGQNGRTQSIYSALQCLVNNRSRLGVAHV